MKIDLVVYCLIVDCVTNCGCFAVVVVVAVNLTADHIWAQLFAYVVRVILNLGKHGEEFWIITKEFLESSKRHRDCLYKSNTDIKMLSVHQSLQTWSFKIFLFTLSHCMWFINVTQNEIENLLSVGKKKLESTAGVIAERQTRQIESLYYVTHSMPHRMWSWIVNRCDSNFKTSAISSRVYRKIYKYRGKHEVSNKFNFVPASGN